MGNRVLIASFKHETNTFSSMPTDIAAFEARYAYRGAEIAHHMGGTKSEMAAFLDAGARYGWEITPTIAAAATPGGRVTSAAFEKFSSDILRAIEAGAPYDAILLALHGAMVVEDHEDGEGRLLRLVRDLVGNTVPIGVTLDLHANVTDTMAAMANVMISYRTYPHIDQYEIGTQAADLIQQTLQGSVRPKTVVARGAMLDGADHGRTTSPGPMRELLALADAYLEEPGVLAVSINGGFPWADIAEGGPTAVVTGDGDSDRYEEIAKSLVEEMWDRRHRTTLTNVGVEEAMASLIESPPDDDRPIVLADFADNPGGGGYGDATGLLAGMLAAKLENAAFGTIYDGEAVQQCLQAGVGNTVTLSLGGKVDPRYGAPLNVTGEVMAAVDSIFHMEGPMVKGARINMGPTVVLRVGGIDIVIVSHRDQVLDLGYFRHAGIVPEKKSFLAVKSAHHFRAAFGPISQRIIVVDDGGGLTSRNYKSLPYENVRRPVFPLDLD